MIRLSVLVWSPISCRYSEIETSVAPSTGWMVQMVNLSKMTATTTLSETVIDSCTMSERASG